MSQLDPKYFLPSTHVLYFNHQLIEPEINPIEVRDAVKDDVISNSIVEQEGECVKCNYDNNGTCMVCGYCRKIFCGDQSSAKRTRSRRTLVADFSKLDLPNDVKTLAESIFRDAGQNHLKDGNAKKSLVLFCVDEAYRKVGKQVDVFQIGEKLGLDKKETRKALSCNMIPSDIRTSSGFIEPSTMITTYAGDLDFFSDEAIEDIRSRFRLFCYYNPLYLEKQIRSLCISYIHAYAFIRSAVPADFFDKMKIRAQPIKTLSKGIIRDAKEYPGSL